jgi:hypothetical protein
MCTRRCGGCGRARRACAISRRCGVLTRQMGKAPITKLMRIGCPFVATVLGFDPFHVVHTGSRGDGSGVSGRRQPPGRSSTGEGKWITGARSSLLTSSAKPTARQLARGGSPRTSRPPSGCTVRSCAHTLVLLRPQRRCRGLVHRSRVMGMVTLSLELPSEESCASAAVSRLCLLWRSPGS